MKTIKTFFLCLKDCFDVFKIRRIESELLQRSVFKDLKYLFQDLSMIPKRMRFCRDYQKRSFGSHSAVMYGASGAGRTRYQVTPSGICDTNPGTEDA